MNLLPEGTHISAVDAEDVGDTIMRMANRGVQQALNDELNYCHQTESNLTGIWLCFPNHPLGYLAQRAKILITAAKSCRLEWPYVISDTELKLAGLTGEAA